MPAGAEIIDVQVQIDHASFRPGSKLLCAWVIVNPEAQTMVRDFLVVGTGQELPGNATAESHIVTLQDGLFVWHIFDGGWQ